MRICEVNVCINSAVDFCTRVSKKIIFNIQSQKTGLIHYRTEKDKKQDNKPGEYLEKIKMSTGNFAGKVKICLKY